MAAPAPSKPTLLIVDDKQTNLLTFDALLSDEYRLILAESGEAALRILDDQHKHVDVIIMDVQMPGMDGFETAARVKRLEHAKDIPIIFVTAVFNEDPWVRKGYESGGIDYFSKPFDPEILRLKLKIYSSFRAREQHLQQRELHIRESEELLKVGRKLASVLEALTVGVLIADIDGRIVQTTEQVSRIFKASEPAAEGAYGAILGWWDNVGKLIKNEGGPLAKALHEETTSHSVPIEIHCLDGTSKQVLASASPLRGLDNRLVGAVVLLRDMTEPRKIEEALEHRVNRLISLGVELEESAVRDATS